MNFPGGGGRKRERERRNLSLSFHRPEAKEEELGSSNPWETLEICDTSILAAL